MMVRGHVAGIYLELYIRVLVSMIINKAPG